MSRILDPIHVAVVADHNVRYFAPPDGGREYPWVSIDDLHDAVGMNRRMRRVFLSAAERPDSRAVGTSEGITRIGPHAVAEGLIGAWTELGKAPVGLDIAYRIGAVEAMFLLFPGITMGEIMVFASNT